MSEKLINLVQEKTENIGEIIADRTIVFDKYIGSIAVSGLIKLSTGAEKIITAGETNDNQAVVENFDEVIRRKNPDNRSYTSSDLRPITSRQIRKAKKLERLERKNMVKLRRQSHLQRSFPGVEKVKGTGTIEGLGRPDYTGNRFSKGEKKAIRKSARQLGRDRLFSKILDKRMDLKVGRPLLKKIQHKKDSLSKEHIKFDDELESAKKKRDQNKRRRKNIKLQRKFDRKQDRLQKRAAKKAAKKKKKENS